MGAISIRVRFGIGFWVALVCTLLDWIGRFQVLGGLGFTIQADSPMGHFMSLLASVPPFVLIGVTILLGLTWCFYPLFESKRYPKFVATIFEIQEPEPPLPGPDLFTAFIICIANSGAPSVIRSFEVEAYATNGATLKAEVFYGPGGFRLTFNGGANHVEYLPEHYIMERARNPVVRGFPVEGVLPVIFRGVTRIDDVDVLRLRVRFADGTGDRAGKAKWWHTEKLVDVRKTVHVAPRTRPGLPPILPGP
jgi:hypothetical protein